MPPYMGSASDGHVFIGPTEASCWGDLNKYLAEHPKARIARKPFRTTKSLYKAYLANKHDARWWIITRQPTEPWSDGKRALVARLTLRNIPNRVQTRTIRGQIIVWNPRVIRAQTEADAPPKYPLAHLFPIRREVAE